MPVSDWCILRTAGRLTLRLADSLSRDGFDVWTPIENRMLRIPRANARRPIRLPIMPSYVFARSWHLVDLLELATLPTTNFSVMHHHESIPLIGDRELQGLRSIEAKRNPRKKGPRLPEGVSVRVKVEGGSFAGMHGKVERSDETNTLVCFSERLVVKISTSLLEPDMIADRNVVAALKAA